MAMLKIGLLFLHLCYLKLALSCGVFSHPYGNISDDQDVEEGSSFSIRCHVFPNISKIHDVYAKDLFLKFENQLLENVFNVDDYTIEYSVYQSTINHTGYYSCYLQLEEHKTPPLVCSSYLAVGYKPSEVQNFSCISKDYTNLTCSWDRPFNPVDTRYILYDYVNNDKDIKRKCPVPLPSSCEFRRDTKPPYMYLAAPRVINFFLDITNSLGSIRQYIKVDHLNIVKPGKARHAMFSNVTQNSVILRVTSSVGMEDFTKGLMYSIKCYSPFTYPDNYKIMTVETKRDVNLHIQNLIPHTQYYFEIKYHLNITGDDFLWSDVLTTDERTESDVPYLAPEISSSAFDVQTIARNRTINLYWKGISQEFENGEGFQYMIRYHEHYVPYRHRREVYPNFENSKVILTNKTTHNFNYMNPDSAYMFVISAVNNVGNSTNETSLVVDKMERLLPPPSDIMVISYGRNYSISWKSPGVDITHFTLYWCQTLKSRPAKCEGPIGWLHTTNASYSLVLSNHNTNYQFAVSANYHRQTSGMVWAPCIVLYNAPYEVRRIELTPKNSTSLKVHWTLSCEAQKKVIKEYALHYCIYDGPCEKSNWHKCKANGSSDYINWPREVLSDTSKSEHVLGSLKPYSCYFVCIRTHTYNGWSERSEIAFVKTMQSAPSDPPSNVIATPVETTIIISFIPPTVPNGNISRYMVFYNKTSMEDTYSREIRVSEMEGNKILLRNSILYYSNYSIELSACVDEACSGKSDPVYVYTGISKPSGIDQPHFELQDGYVNITWKDPAFPNGPLDFYQIKVSSNDTERDETYNISGHNYFALDRNCVSEPSNAVYYFTVRAVNYKDGMPLYGDYSNPAKSEICPVGSTSNFIAGIVTGATLGISLLVFLTYKFMTWFIGYAKDAKSTKIQLPKGLDSPLDNLTTYDKFKSGLQNEMQDAGMPFERPYDRLCPFPSEGDSMEVKPKSLTDHENDSSQRDSTQRNHSGGSDDSKCHDSISSANTSKTHVSMDSGAEVESPPSPDGHFSDSSSTNTLPSALKPQMQMLHQSKGLTSKDSGLEGDDSIQKFVTHNFDSTAKSLWYVKKKPNAFALPVLQFNPNLPSYSKFSMGMSGGTAYVAGSEQNRGFMEKMSLSNSEPSVADFDIEDSTEPLINQPYSKFGLARSASNGLNVAERRNSNSGYSKFGSVYCPLKNYPHVAPPTAFTALTYMNNPYPDIYCVEGFGGKNGKENPKEVQETSGGIAYSKFGVAQPFSDHNSSVTCEDKTTSPPKGKIPNGGAYLPQKGVRIFSRVEDGDLNKSQPTFDMDPNIPQMSISDFITSNNLTTDLGAVTLPVAVSPTKCIDGTGGGVVSGIALATDNNHNAVSSNEKLTDLIPNMFCNVGDLPEEDETEGQTSGAGWVCPAKSIPEQSGYVPVRGLPRDSSAALRVPIIVSSNSSHHNVESV